MSEHKKIDPLAESPGVGDNQPLDTDRNVPNGMKVLLCPKCGTAQVRQSVRRGILEYVISFFGFHPYDCTYYTCLHRFYSGRKLSAQSIDRSVSDHLYDGIKKEISPQQNQIVSDNSPEYDQQQISSIDGKGRSNSLDKIDRDRYNFLSSGQLSPRKVLTLNWNTNGKNNTHTIYSQDRSGCAGRVKLGRNPAQCDLVFTDRTVSGINAEIYFDCQSRNFYLSNLRAINPPFINQKKVVSTVAIQSGMILYLGRVPITIEIDYDFADIEPTLGFEEPTHLFDREEH